MGDIGKNIRFLRIRKKLSQDQLAESLHVTRQTVSNYETGRSRPDVEMLAALAEALNADVKEILYGPAGRERRIRLLRRLALGAVLTLLVGVLYFRLSAWAWQLMQARYLGDPLYLVLLSLQPLFYALLGWTLLQGGLILLRAEPLNSRWAVWARRAILAIIAACFLGMVPVFLYLVKEIFQMLDPTASSQISNGPTNVCLLVLGRCPWLLSWGSVLVGIALGILGFPARRAVRDPDTKHGETIDSPE